MEADSGRFRQIQGDKKLVANPVAEGGVLGRGRIKISRFLRKLELGGEGRNRTENDGFQRESRLKILVNQADSRRARPCSHVLSWCPLWCPLCRLVQPLLVICCDFANKSRAAETGMVPGVRAKSAGHNVGTDICMWAAMASSVCVLARPKNASGDHAAGCRWTYLESWSATNLGLRLGIRVFLFCALWLVRLLGGPQMLRGMPSS